VRQTWLIRHGESAANAGDASTEPAEIPLTPWGHQQSAQVAARMPASPTLIVTSPYLRARQTAAPTIARFPSTPTVEWPVQEFTYLGDLHGMVTTGRERRPHVEAYWRLADPHVSIGGAETFASFLGRARACLTRLDEQPAEPVAVFTHEMFIRAISWLSQTDVTTVDSAAMRAFHTFSLGFTVPNGTVVDLRH
jgi:broad specificity phosphatase PhoE